MTDLPVCSWRSIRDDGKASCASNKIRTPAWFDAAAICTRCPFVDHQPAAQPTPLRGAFPFGGAGTELSAILSWWGVDAEANCKCKGHARTMDLSGPDWCEANLETIVGWMREDAERRGLPFVAWLARAMVRKAIKRARLLTAASG